MEESPVKRRGSKAYQIFPEANLNEESDSSSYPEDFLYRRERLPSIVVEPTDHTEVESWERYIISNNAEQEDSHADQTYRSSDGEQQGETKMEDGLVARKSSIEPSQSQRHLSQLTPPASPTPPEAAPPTLKS
ncbi:uncharacterized protein LOC144410407 isoform X2 [Gasterosteus aculeatus]